MNGSVRHEAATLYDEEAYNALAYLMINRLRKWPRLIILATGLVSVCGSAAMIILEGRVTAVSAIVLLLGNLMGMFGLFARRFAVKMMTASVKKGHVPKNIYLFKDDGITIQADGISQDYSYTFIRRVMDMSGFLFLFLKDGQVYMLRQKDVKTDPIAFRGFLEDRLTQTRPAKG